MCICMGECALFDEKLNISINTCNDVREIGVLGSHSREQREDSKGEEASASRGASLTGEILSGCIFKDSGTV